MPRLTVFAVPFICVFLGQNTLLAQRGAGDWTTSGFDAQRSSWVRSDAKISPETLMKPGFELVWKVNLNELGPRGFWTPPALLDFYIGFRGFRTLGFFGGSANTVVALDTDLARLEWTKKFDVPSSARAASAQCPGGMTTPVARPTSIGFPPVPTGRGTGRGNPAKSGVGEPFEGAVTLKQTPVQFQFPPTPKPAKAGARRESVPVNPFVPRAQYVYALSADGKFHSMYVSNGEEPKPPLQFLPPNAYAQGLIVFENWAYVSTANSCGGVENGVWALDLETQKVNSWKGGANGISGSAGPSVGPDGTIYVASGPELVALEERTLKPKSSYKLDKGSFSSSPVVFDFKGKDLIAVMSKDGRLHVLDSAALGKAIATTPTFSAADYDTGALASWQDPSGTRWVLAPAAGAGVAELGARTNGPVKNGAIAAWKVVEQDGSIKLEPGWVSRDMVSPLTPIIVSGVVFALSSGEFRGSDSKITPAQRAQRSGRAVLYALDPESGKELWNSGETIGTFVKGVGLSAGGSRVYVSAQDGMQYVFGFPIEH